jgi:hypothetical protein
MTEPSTDNPDTVEDTEPQENGNQANRRPGGRLRMIFAVCLGGLMMGDVALYSLYQSVHSRVEAQDRRIERMNKLLTDLLASRDNAKKIEEIEQQVDGVVTAVEDLQHMVTDSRSSNEDDSSK